MHAWLNYINSLYYREIDLGLSRIIDLSRKLGVSTFSCPVVTVAGTNGKGSVIKLLESIYLASGYQVAAYTSPHLFIFNERLRFNSKPMLDRNFIEAFALIEKNRDRQSLSFFEFTTLACLYICKKLALDVLLLEVGLGGRLDAVNVIDPDISVITTVDIDHTDWLGNDRESIGREKAGIFRAHHPVICGDPNPPRSIFEVAQPLQSPIFQFMRDFSVIESKKTWKWLGPRNVNYGNLPLPQLKIQNVATSLMVINQLQDWLPVRELSIVTGIRKAFLPNCFEKVNQPVSLIFDVAHNPQAARYLAEQLCCSPHSGRTFAVIGMLKDKDIQGTIEPMLTCVDRWYVGSLPEMRGAAGEKITDLLRREGVKNCYNFTSIDQAFKQAIAQCEENDRVVVFGSFYTVAMAKKSLFLD
ncbi:bifunctional tetrahydrofolate synthase/dihydrofolate synthase [Coxiella endosymbiont of Amblyomma americanum]|uniref:bifunctional tetrahydrofolate synthase/dihydrofolate synthase n=1 Tax=Coxiella endosymbiont of Amblyomma americanum TaxID=325775 RepID=UPI00057D9229|nr:bifunctional tetrahydrofolate synthase/dihydrofolate synthase [Coxiella endosymbiont of Amblyomma americanum]AJC50568.1 diaminohydroxyphosphoribosylaminopyrimidine deaminase [Coxiella endosymbiont of Amblyomma americanum]AUJ59054.1 bifunctional tetrahydrofolate synthase/dihydrofolate synthase [Coxiella-like endosymbiont of Amblyomma americanum]